MKETSGSGSASGRPMNARGAGSFSKGRGGPIGRGRIARVD